MASVSRVLETLRLRRPMADVPYEFDIDHPGSNTPYARILRAQLSNRPVVLQYLLYGYGRVLWLVWIFDA